MALALTRKQLAKQYEPPADYGFFGPDSVTWKVWSYPTSFILGFVRSVTIEHLDPNLAAAVIQSGGVKYRHTTGRATLYASGFNVPSIPNGTGGCAGFEASVNDALLVGMPQLRGSGAIVVNDKPLKLAPGNC